MALPSAAARKGERVANALERATLLPADVAAGRRRCSLLQAAANPARQRPLRQSAVHERRAMHSLGMRSSSPSHREAASDSFQEHVLETRDILNCVSGAADFILCYKFLPGRGSSPNPAVGNWTMGPICLGGSLEPWGGTVTH